jgi:hypothetical protein
MYDWLNEVPFAWLLVAALALFYIAATAIYTRVMIFVVNRSDRPFAKWEEQQARVEPPDSHITRPPPVSPIVSASDGEAATATWDRVTSSEIELMKRVLAVYRSELLAHHAEELRALDEQQAEIEALEQSISAFAEKYQTERQEYLELPGENITRRNRRAPCSAGYSASRAAGSRAAAARENWPLP